MGHQNLGQVVASLPLKGHCSGFQGFLSLCFYLSKKKKRVSSIILVLWWVIRQRFIFGKTCSGKINLQVLNFLVFMKRYQLDVLLYHLSLTFLLFYFSWNIKLLTKPHWLRAEDLRNLMSIHISMNLSSSFLNMRVWSLLSSNLFIVKSFFLILSNQSTPVLLSQTKFIWKSKAPSKVKTFVWLDQQESYHQWLASTVKTFRSP